LPPGSDLDRTDAVVKKITHKFSQVDGVKNMITFIGFSGATQTRAPNQAVLYTLLKSFKYRSSHGIGYHHLLGELNKVGAQIKKGKVIVIPPPAVQGIGNTVGFKMMIQDRGNVGYRKLEKATRKLSKAANRDPAIVG